MADEGAQRKMIFDDVRFTLIPGQKFPPAEVDEIKNLLLDYGAREVPFKKGEHGLPIYPLEEITHLISPDVEFTAYADNEMEIEDRMIPIVTPEWVRVSVAKGRCPHVRPYNPDPRYFFSGIVATAADLPEGDRDAIYGGVSAMGGQYSTSLSKLTTHLIALSLDNPRCQQAIEKKLNVKIVLPHWFDDCLKLGRRIDETPYTLPNADVEYTLSNDKPAFPEVKLRYTFEHKQIGTKVPTLRGNNKFLTDKKIYFSEDLQIHQMLKDNLKSLIEDAGGEVVGKFIMCNVVICQWRDGADYVYAARKGFEVGNLTWLYWMIHKGEWANPTRRLLHYPKPKDPVPGMENMRITVSNYGGDARLYIEALIQACGATFTRNMKQDNTHLITARENSDKCTAARDWNILMTNHLWLEESYARNAVQAVTTPRYTHWPQRTNLQEVVGRTPIDLEAIQQFFIPPEPEADQDEELSDAPDRDEAGGSSLKIDASMATMDLDPSSSTVGPSTSSETPKVGSKSTGRGRGRPPRSSESAAAQTPVRAAPVVEPQSMTSTGRRAKDKAINKLHDQIMPDVLQFEKEKKRKGGVLHGGRRSLSPKKDESKASVKKRTLDEDGTTSESDSKSKKQKKKSGGTGLKKPEVFLLTTSHQPWIDDPKKEDSDKKILRELGVLCIEQPDPRMTHLAAPNVIRTQKFISSIAYAPIVVTSQWIKDCVDKAELLDTKSYLLKEAKDSKMVLSQSLQRAKKNGGHLLESYTFYITPKVSGGFDTMKGIAEANGAECVQYKQSHRSSLKKYDSDSFPSNELFMLSTPSEDKLHKGFKKMAKDSGWEPIVVGTDFLLDAAMQQQVPKPDEYKI